MRNDANTLTMGECEQVKRSLNAPSAPIELRCYSFNLMNRELVWFEITQFPAAMTAEEAYARVEQTLIEKNVGPWAERVIP